MRKAIFTLFKRKAIFTKADINFLRVASYNKDKLIVLVRAENQKAHMEELLRSFNIDDYKIIPWYKCYLMPSLISRQEERPRFFFQLVHGFITVILNNSIIAEYLQKVIQLIPNEVMTFWSCLEFFPSFSMLRRLRKTPTNNGLFKMGFIMAIILVNLMVFFVRKLVL